MQSFKLWLLNEGITQYNKITIDGKTFSSGNQALLYLWDTRADKYELFVSYRSIPKLGINPKNNHDTPGGIYFYPLSHVATKISGGPGANFAMENPYIYVVKFKDNANIVTVDPNISNQKGLDCLNIFPADIVADAKKIVIEKLKSPRKRLKLLSDYSMLWLITQEMSKGNTWLWTKYLRSCNIDGFEDYNTEMIHPNEPEQTLIINPSVIDVLYELPNSDSNPLGKYQLQNLSDENLKNYYSKRKVNLDGILKAAKNPDDIIKFIIDKNPQDINDVNISDVFHNTKETKNIALLIAEKLNLTTNMISTIINLLYNKDENISKFIKTLGKEKLKNLYQDELQYILDYNLDTDAKNIIKSLIPQAKVKEPEKEFIDDIDAHFANIRKKNPFVFDDDY
jgi:hypothetical protein